MSQLDPRQVLTCLNELGYQNITAKQLKEFMKDLKKLIKYERKRTQSQKEEEEEVPPAHRETEIDTPYKSIHTVHRSSEENHALRNHVCRACRSSTWCQACIHSFNYGPYHKGHQSCEVPDGKNANESIAPTTKTNISQNRILQHTQKEQEKENIPLIEVQDRLQSLELEAVEELQPISVEIKRSAAGNSLLDEKELQRQSQQSVKSRPSSEKQTFMMNHPQSNNLERPATRSACCRYKVRRSKSYIVRKSPVKITKSDPVALYQKYKREWKKHRLPGEDNRFPERWAIRERLLGDTQRMRPSSSLEVVCSKTRQGIPSKDDKATKQARNVNLTKARF